MRVWLSFRHGGTRSRPRGEGKDEGGRGGGQEAEGEGRGANGGRPATPHPPAYTCAPPHLGR